MMRRNRWTTVLCLGLLLFGGHRLLASEPEGQPWAELKTRMGAEGWKEIAQGVFERRLGATKVEHVGFGREGLAWHIGKLTRQLEGMMLEYESYPSEDLAESIDNLSVFIARSKTGLRNMPEGLSSATAASGCSGVVSGATADAYYRTDVQGVAAVADAWFSNTCGASGDTYARAYARATTNGTIMVQEQEDPDTGTSVASHASASTAGASFPGVPCYSVADSTALSYTLGVSHSVNDTNSLCPVPLAVSITSGPTAVPFTTTTCSNQTWGAAASGGVSPYTYAWYVNNSLVGTGSSYTRSVCYNHADFTLKVVATDANGATANSSRVIDVSYTPPGPPEVTINGSDFEQFNSIECRNVTWTSTISGGTSPYTYQWKYNGITVGTGSSYTRSVCSHHQDFLLSLTITDSTSATAFDDHYVYVFREF